ncbi:GNAT family N-acetyltransferase [Phreatobacter sp. AB_2022a]|uniref:GNAT family N-acetyltransferase n=1 Tax=Phreatobacter sp. AB_2022a TaxID=3003134 RepID=UPI00228735F2|nr:GNAT family N-acetyltransferase [Phreatobacter sp. AB_2022a]MCZ0736235.1 GNAT family N-acetyltransferase [Phreatobacter sp. AB_2022a]
MTAAAASRAGRPGPAGASLAPRPGSLSEPLAARWVGAAAWPGLIEAWERLARVATPNVFLNPAFALAARGVDPGAGLGAVVVEADGGLVGFAPGRLKLGGSTFVFWTHPYAPLGAPLILADAEEAVLGAIVDHLKAQGVVALDWPLMDEGAPLARALARLAARRGLRVDVIEAHQRAALVTAEPPQPSKEARRLRRRLGEQGRVETVSTAAGFDAQAAKAAFLALEASGWKGARGTALAMSEPMRAFFDGAVGRLMARGEAQIDLIMLDGRPVAAGIVLRAGTRGWYWKTAYDETLARFSPGVLVTHAITARLAADASVQCVDSCAIAGHPMIDRVWPARLAMTSRLVALGPDGAGTAYRMVLAAIRMRRAARDCAKAALARIRRARARAGG